MGIFKFWRNSKEGGIDYLAEIKAFHREAVEPYLKKPRGSLSGAVESLEKHIGFELPAAYQQYLLWMGDDKNGIFKGTECFTDNVVQNNKWLPELLKKNNIKVPLPADYLAFFSHQGYQMGWFALPKTQEDPPIWFYNEGHDSVPQVQGTFTQFILGQMQGLAPLLPKLCSKLT